MHEHNEHCSGTMCHIIPPHMMESLAKSPEATIRDAAIANIASAERTRAIRQTMAEFKPMALAMNPIAANAAIQRTIHDAQLAPT